MRSKKIELDDGRKFKVLLCSGGVLILEKGCKTCGHGVQIFPDSYVGTCAWEGKHTDFDHDLIDKLREKMFSPREPLP